MDQRLRRALATSAAVIPLFYVLLTVVLGALSTDYDPLKDTQSELGAVDAPLGLVMNVGGFMLLGLAILACAAAYGATLTRGWATTAAVALLSLAGVGMVIVGFFPCDSGCVDVTTTGRLHGVFSAPAAIGLPAAAIVSWWVFGKDARFGPRWRAASLIIGIVTLASGPLIQAEVVGQSNGLLQRLGMWPALLWMSAVSWRLRALE